MRYALAVRQSSNKRINQSIIQSVSQTISKLGSQSISQPISQPNCLSVEPLPDIPHQTLGCVSHNTVDFEEPCREWGSVGCGWNTKYVCLIIRQHMLNYDG